MNLNGANAVRDTRASANAAAHEARGNDAERSGRTDRKGHADGFERTRHAKGDDDSSKVKNDKDHGKVSGEEKAARREQIAEMARALGISMRRAGKELQRQATVNRAAEGTPFEPGKPMPLETAQARVANIYSTAFPGVQFTAAELARPIQLLESGAISEADLRARVTRGAELVTDPNAIKKALAGGGSDPHRASIGAQQMRLAHILALMRQGILPEGKFNIAGTFMYIWKGHNTEPVRGRFVRATNARQGGSPMSSMLSLTPKQANRRGGSILEIPEATSSEISETLSDLSGAGAKTNSPVMLDLNHDGRLGVTGESTARDRAAGSVSSTVDFDIDGDGDRERIEWMNGDGDAMLVDDRDGGATAAAAGNGVIDGRRLFGDQGGAFANGYEKMAALDANRDGKLAGHELDGLKAWVDDGDAVVEAGELKTLLELGITEMSIKMQLTANERGELLMRSTFTQNGVQHVSEDVWFGEEDDSDNLAATTARVAAGLHSQTLHRMVALVDATIGELDSVAREAEDVHANTTLASRSRTALLASGFRA